MSDKINLFFESISFNLLRRTLRFGILHKRWAMTLAVASVQCNWTARSRCACSQSSCDAVCNHQSHCGSVNVRRDAAWPSDIYIMSATHSAMKNLMKIFQTQSSFSSIKSTVFDWVPMIICYSITCYKTPARFILVSTKPSILQNISLVEFIFQ